MKEVFLIVRAYYGVNIHSDAQGEYGTILDSNDVFPDLALINAATILNNSNDYEVKVIDAVIDGPMLPDKLIKEIITYKYDKLIVKTTAPSFKSDLELIRQIKKAKSHSYIMIAGQIAKVLKNWINENTDIDEVIDQPLDGYIYEYVHGRKADIDDLPCPDYTLVNYKKYTDDNKNIRLTIQASRGCPMSCAYCPYIKYYEEIEYRSVDKVIDDIKALVSLGVDVIQFRDQFFTCDKKRIIEICNRIIQENIKINWICETRLDSLDNELIDLMKQAGMFLICFGVESGNPEVLDSYNSDKGEADKQKEIIKYLNDKEIITMAFYIVGFPEDTWESLFETYKYADYLDSKYAIFNEYTDFNYSNLNTLTPDIFNSFENTTKVGRDTFLSREEIRYIIGLFSTMYTLKNDTLEKAYRYNYKLVKDSREVSSEIVKYENDLVKMSEIISSRCK